MLDHDGFIMLHIQWSWSTKRFFHRVGKRWAAQRHIRSYSKCERGLKLMPSEEVSKQTFKSFAFWSIVLKVGSDSVKGLVSVDKSENNNAKGEDFQMY